MTASSDLRRRVDHLIALIDETLNRQVNEILHDPRFRAPESSWRGLALLVRMAGGAVTSKSRCSMSAGDFWRGRWSARAISIKVIFSTGL